MLEILILLGTSLLSLSLALTIPDGCKQVVKEQMECMVPMRDGVRLHTMLNWPNTSKYGEEGLTIIMDRSPYTDHGTELEADLYLPFGFLCVRQDVRGTGQSEGFFNWFQEEQNDSWDTNTWLAAQSFSNGIINQMGGSADGIVSFQSASTDPPWLQAQFVIWSTTVGYPIIFPNGAYTQDLTNHWAEHTVSDNSTWLIANMESNEAPSAWWDALNFSTDEYNAVSWPTILWAGWYDIFLAGNLAAWEGYQTESDASVRGKQILFIDPEGHCADAAPYFPENTHDGRVALPALMSIDMFLGKDYSNIPNASLITFYVMGAWYQQYPNAPGNYWTTMDEFPAYTPVTYYFVNDGTTTTLSTSPPPSDTLASTSYLYDPANPVKTLCGSNLWIDCGPCDQRDAEARDDVLVFTSPVFSQPFAITGPLIAVLYVSSTAVDTDFMVKLTDVYPEPYGDSRIINDNAYRMRWRNYDYAENMTASTVYEIEISLWNTSYVFDAGHALRVDVQSSNYPRFSVNPNNGWPLNTTDPGPLYQATNTIYHSSQYPSRFIVPQVTMDQLPVADVEFWTKQAKEVLGEEGYAKLYKDPLPDRLRRRTNHREQGQGRREKK